MSGKAESHQWLLDLTHESQRIKVAMCKNGKQKMTSTLKALISYKRFDLGYVALG